MRLGLLALALFTPAVLLAQADTTRRPTHPTRPDTMRPHDAGRGGRVRGDTARMRHEGMRMDRDTMRMGDSARMRGRMERGGMQDTTRAMRMHRTSLTRAQIRELQEALARQGCNPGPIDGRLGPRTHRGIACARQKLNVTGNNANDLLRALGVTFTVRDSTGMGPLNRAPRR